MFRYFSKLLDDTKIYLYNISQTDNNSTSHHKQYRNYDEYSNEITVQNIDDKQLKIDVLLFVRQYKNTYYKYTNKSKFNEELYNSFVNDSDKYFDGGMTAYDDDDEIPIFDRYILEYIKNRNDVMTFLQCHRREIVIKQRLCDLYDVCHIQKDKPMDILFAIDLAEKELFTLCYEVVLKSAKISDIKNVVFSFIYKFKNDYIRIKLCKLTKDKSNHPYIVLENFLL